MADFLTTFNNYIDDLEDESVDVSQEIADSMTSILQGERTELPNGSVIHLKNDQQIKSFVIGLREQENVERIINAVATPRLNKLIGASVRVSQQADLVKGSIDPSLTPKQQRAVLRASQSTIIKQFETVSSDLRDAIRTAEATGDPEALKQLVENLKEDAKNKGPIFSALMSNTSYINSTAKAANQASDISLANQSARKKKEKNIEQAADQQLMRWIANVGNEPATCTPCLTRHYQVKTLQEWKRVGMPGTNSWGSWCKSHCRCKLIPVDLEGAIELPEDLNEGIKRVKKIGDKRSLPKGKTMRVPSELLKENPDLQKVLEQAEDSIEVRRFLRELSK